MASGQIADAKDLEAVLAAITAAQNPTTLFSDYTTYNNIATLPGVEQSLLSYSVPGGTLANNGEMLEFRAWGFRKQTGADNNQLIPKFGAQQLQNQAHAQELAWMFQFWIVRTGATLQRVFGTYQDHNASTLQGLNGGLDVPLEPTEPLASPVLIDVRCMQPSGAPNRIKLFGMIVRKWTA